jgi:uncharacterized protein (DUF697 family)
MKRFLGFCALAVTIAGGASAATLTATSADGIAPSFTIGFTDSNNNNLFDLSELEAFSGFFLFVQADVVLAVPEIAGISVAGSVPGAILGPLAGVWYFDGAGSLDNTFDVGAAPGFWTYDISFATVPLPATLPLVVAGLGGLALSRRRARA